MGHIVRGPRTNVSLQCIQPSKPSSESPSSFAFVGRGRGHIIAFGICIPHPGRILCFRLSVSPSPPQFPNYLTLEEEADGIEVPTIHFVDWFWRTACTMPRGEYDSIFLSSSTYSWAVRVARWLDIKFTLLAYTGPESIQTVARHARSALREAPPARLNHPNALAARNALQEGTPVWTPNAASSSHQAVLPQ